MPNERLIYEWLGYHYHAFEIQKVWPNGDGCEMALWKCAECGEERTWYSDGTNNNDRDNPPLDTNTAFGEAIPKLAEEGVKVSFVSGCWYFEAHEWPSEHGLPHDPDFWEALTEYLEAKDA